jgi:hypothetical protein
MAETLHAPSVRIGSTDRTLVAERLVAHYQAGRLPRTELELRLTKVAHARTDDDLHLLTIDLPDVAGPARPASLPAGTKPITRGSTPSALCVAFDISVLLLTFAAGVCLALLLIVAATNSSSSSPGDTLFVAMLATLGAFTVGAGSVHLLHRAFGKR